jgi:uncharacterized protein
MTTKTNYQMRSLLVKISLLLLLALPLTAQDLPQPMKPVRLVNDFAQVLNRMELNKLETMLVSYNDSTSTQITVVTVQSLGGYEIADYANKLYEAWGIGQKSKNNGLLILLSMEERAVRMEVGYGLEDRLTDALSRRIIERDMVPNFRSGDYAGGLYAASKSVIQVLEGAYTADAKGKGEKQVPGSLIIILIVVILIIIVNSKNGGGQSFSGKGRAGYQPPFFFPMGGGGGFGGGFGGGGGGFGGFGGGMSGGGGASGRW